MLRNHDQCSAGGSGIICTEEGFVFVIFGIDVGAQYAIDVTLPWVWFSVAESSSEIGEFNFSNRCITFEFLEFDLPSTCFKFLRNSERTWLSASLPGGRGPNARISPVSACASIPSLLVLSGFPRIHMATAAATRINASRIRFDFTTRILNRSLLLG
jgi:hypothetical protein